MKEKISLIPIFSSSVAAGFPSPAEDFVDRRIDLNNLLIAHPSATFFVRVKGHSMQEAGIDDGDLLVVDKSLKPTNGDIVVAFLNGEFTVKKISKGKNFLYLVPQNEDYKSIKIKLNDDFSVWGVVAHVIKSFRPALTET